MGKSKEGKLKKEKSDGNKKSENKNEKKSKKKLIIILLILLIVLLIVFIIGGIFYLFKRIDDSVLGITNRHNEALLEFTEDIKYGTELSYEDLVSKLVNKDNIEENTQIHIFVNDTELNNGDNYKFDQIGTYTISAKLEYLYTYKRIVNCERHVDNEKSFVIEVKDTEKPVISGISNKEITVGDTINLADGITATDNVDGNVEVTIEGNADTAKVGEYSIKAKATDKSGNVAEETFTVTVKEKVIAENKTTTKNNKQSNSTKNSSSSSASSSGSTGSSETKRTFTTAELKAEAGKVKSNNRSAINTILSYTNKYRKEAGVSDLTLNEELTTAACMRAIEMANYDKFSHTRPDGSSCFTVLNGFAIQKQAYTLAENIAYSGSAAKSAELWRNSAGHYSNIINSDFKRIGIGAYKFGGRWYCVQIFSN